MKKLVRFALVLIILAAFVPVYAELDDGGTREYSALLYRITLRRTISHQEDVSGHLMGTEIHILGFEVYSDVRFVPSDRELFSCN